jgi:uncharacterized protein YqiB (DUF1249 family)
MQSFSDNIPIIKRQLRNATALHEANFAKLARVVPGLRDLQGHIFLSGPKNTRLELRILETSKFTKTFSLHLNHNNTKQIVAQPWASDLQMKIRNYYDASVTEVLAFQKQHRLSARYAYPNNQMYQRNEKWQTNQFLGEWLDYCLRKRCFFHGNGNTEILGA